MNFVRKLSVAVLGAAILIPAAVVAQQAIKPETLIKQRQSAFQVIGWTCGRVKLALDAAQFDREEVKQAATALAAVANSGLGQLFAAGSEQGKGWHDTAVKPEFFQPGSKAGEYAQALSRETAELARIAGSAEPAALKAQFGKVAQTCRACHDDFRRKD